MDDLLFAVHDAERGAMERRKCWLEPLPSQAILKEIGVNIPADRTAMRRAVRR